MINLFRSLKKAVGLRRFIKGNGECDTGLLHEIKHKTLAEKNKIPRKTPLSQARFVVFDLETTGLNPFGGDEITSIGAVIVEKGVLRKEPIFQTLVHPNRPIPLIATQITGITDEMVKDAPTPLWAINAFLDFCQNSILVAHYADFDLTFLNLKLRHCKASIKHPVVDTHVLARAFLAEKNITTLDSLISYFDLSVRGRHTSIGDSMVTARLLLKFLPIIEKKGIYTLDDLSKYLRIKDL